MANINTETIAGFNDMTAEQKVEALLGMEIPDEVDLSGYVKKSVFDAKATEAANLGKQLKAKAEEAKARLSEDEQRKLAEEEAKQENAQRYADLEAKYNELIHKSTVSEYNANFTALGFEEKLAGETANALADGDSAKVFVNLKKFLDAYKKSIEAELMSKTPRPDGSGRGEDGKESIAITKVKQLFGEQSGTSKNYEAVLGNYLKK